MKNTRLKPRQMKRCSMNCRHHMTKGSGTHAGPRKEDKPEEASPGYMPALGWTSQRRLAQATQQVKQGKGRRGGEEKIL